MGRFNPPAGGRSVVPPKLLLNLFLRTTPDWFTISLPQPASVVGIYLKATHGNYIQVTFQKQIQDWKEFPYMPFPQ